jgi:feruloyl esterase
MRARAFVGLALVAPTVILAAAQATAPQVVGPAAAPNACEAIRDFRQPDVAIVDAAVISAGQLHPSDNLAPAQRPARAYCRVEARIEGNVGFLAWLPLREDWNGRMLGNGNGGDGGSFAVGGIARAVREGMVGITTDTGHKSSEARWALSRKKYEDYTHRSQHLTAVLGRELAAAYYGSEPNKSYFMGCSGGGRQAQKEIELFPDDYDGVIAGAPASQHSAQMARKQWIVLAAEQQPDAALSNGQWSAVAAEVKNQCDALDGLADGLVNNPLACKFDAAALACKPGQTGDSCLTPANIGFVNLMYSPFKDENGVERGPRPIPGIRTARTPPATGVSGFGYAVHQNPNWTHRDLVIGRDIDALDRMFPELTVNDPDLTKFAQSGGKAILYHGWADSTDMSAYMIQQYDRVVAFPANGGLEKVQETMRVFMAPISGHCGGNDGPTWQSPGQVGYSPEGDLLQLMIRWVEQGDAPDTVLASQVADGKIVRTLPLCPYPAVPRYKGSGPVNEAASFECR